MKALKTESVSTKLGLLVILLFWYGFFLAQRINLVTADLGRHLQNGRIILENLAVIKTNFYSYTQADFPVINHHWASGVIFYLIEKAVGFIGLSGFFVLISLLAFSLFFYTAQAGGRAKLAFIVGLLLVPLLGERVEIRPEIFSYLFTGCFFLILKGYCSGRLRWRWLLVLPLLQLIWVNLHICFFLGPVMVLVFWLFDRRRPLAGILASLAVASLINPWGVKAALAPLTIWRNYSYLLVENQSVWFLEKLKVISPNYLTFKLVLGLFVTSWLACLITKRRLVITDSLLGLIVAVMACVAIRNFTLFGLLVFTPLVRQLDSLWRFKSNWRSWLLVGVVVFLGVNYRQRLTVLADNFGLGLSPAVNQAAVFWQKEKLKGPIFNNYDIGGYLIYHLFSGEKVFIDNRPEAYPAAFFQEVYIPMQSNEAVWQEQEQRYHFNAIFFSHRDLTPWGQQFLIKRIDDPGWVPVYADQQIIIFLKRNQLNQPVIERYEIPRSRFQVVRLE